MKHLKWILILLFSYDKYLFNSFINSTDTTFNLYSCRRIIANCDSFVFVRKIEVEVENLDMVKEAVEAGADIIMLDNMSYDEMKEALLIIDGHAETECSGNVTKENIEKLTGLGVDYISSGALTHSAPILDISLKGLHVI